jgi:hypothetical protein
MVAICLSNMKGIQSLVLLYLMQLLLKFAILSKLQVLMKNQTQSIIVLGKGLRLKQVRFVGKRPKACLKMLLKELRMLPMNSTQIILIFVPELLSENMW